MNNNLLLTKLHIPKPSPRVIERPRLLARLDAGLEEGCKLVVLSAPVGYGKSTLVSSWLARNNVSAAWLSLDAEDNNPVRFWSYVVAALQTVQPAIGQEVQSLLQTTQSPSIEYILCDLINQIAVLPQKIVLILDDYHLIETLELHEKLSFLLHHLPPQMRLMVTTREDPPWLLPQMRAKRQALELRAKDLRFTIDECAQFLHNQALHLQEAEISILSQRTEGWVAGLQMAALSLCELDDPTSFIASFAGDNQYIADYLVSEVLNRQPNHIRDFLLRTSIVERFTPALCAMLVGDSAQQSGEIIRQIETLGLFVISLDHIREWYRYHKLFSDLLRYRLRQNDPVTFIVLNRAASRWFEEQDLVEEAVKYALIGEDFDKAAELIEKSGMALLGQSRLTALQHWINALPEKTVQEHPYLSVLLVWVGALTGQSELAKRQLALAEEYLAFAPATLHSEIVCQIELLRAYALRTAGDLGSSTEYAQKALCYLPKDNVFLDCTIHLNLGGNYWLQGDFSVLEEPLKRAASFVDIAKVEYPALAAVGFLANAYLQQGQLRKAASLCKEVVERETRRTHPAIAYVYLERGELLYEQNNLSAAEEILVKAIQLGESVDKVVNVVRARQVLARVRKAMGADKEALALMEEADALFKQSTLRYQSMHQIEYDYYRIRCLLCQQNEIAARQWADEYAGKRETFRRPWALLLELAYAQVLLGDGQWKQALAVLQTCEASATSFHAGGWVIRSLLLQALCHEAAHDSESAMKTLCNAFKRAEAEGYIRTFVDHGAPMQRLLKLAATRRVAPDYVAKLLALFPAPLNERRTPAAQALPEALTEQELKILRLMAAHLSHREIAEELYLSTNTVKWHTVHIYEKLGVNRRALAVSRAHELRLL